MFVVVAFAAVDFDGQLLAVDIVGGGYFADEHRVGVGAPGAHVKFVCFVGAVFGVGHLGAPNCLKY